MKYFESFSKLVYTFGQDNFNQQLVTNIFARSNFLREVANNVDIAYEYQVQDSDTPEIIAHKVYGDAYRSWIVLLYNKIINPYYDWPMKNDVLETYVANKYHITLEQSKSTIHHYEKEIEQTATYGGVVLDKNTTTYTISTYDYNQNTGSLVLNTLPNTADTYVTISTETFNYNTYILTVTTNHKAVSNFTYEFNENEKRRKIKLLEDIYVAQIEQEFKEIMRDG